MAYQKPHFACISPQINTSLHFIASNQCMSSVRNLCRMDGRENWNSDGLGLVRYPFSLSDIRRNVSSVRLQYFLFFDFITARSSPYEGDPHMLITCLLLTIGFVGAYSWVDRPLFIPGCSLIVTGTLVVCWVDTLQTLTRAAYVITHFLVQETYLGIVAHTSEPNIRKKKRFDCFCCF